MKYLLFLLILTVCLPSLVVGQDDDEVPLRVARGCYVLPDCVPLNTTSGTVYLANQTILIMEGQFFEPKFSNLAHIEIFADSGCTFKLQTIDWWSPIVDEGPSNATSSTIPGLKLAQKVAWDLIAPSAFYDKTLWFGPIVSQYNALSVNCSWDEPWDLGHPHSVKRKTCVLETACPLHDMLFIRKLAGQPKQLTVSSSNPPCDPSQRVESPASWWLSKTDDLTLCGHHPDQYTPF